jgi:antitoxin VapB
MYRQTGCPSFEQIAQNWDGLAPAERSRPQILGRIKGLFYPRRPMGMNIKDPEVHAMARQLAARRCTTVTNAVRPALSAELERSEAADTARQGDLQELLERFRQLHWPEAISCKEAQDVLYDDQGLPV